MKHTPGPWRACNNGKCKCGQIWSTTADHPVAEVTRGDWGDAPDMVYGSVPIEQAEANARLIAAAPELLEALKEITEAFEGRCADWENPEFNDCYNKARAAIAKAES